MKSVFRIVTILAILVLVVFAGRTFFNKTPHKTGNQVVYLRLQSFALSLNPLKMADVESRQVATLLHSGLVFQEQDGKVFPALAKSWSHDGNTWTFTLRDNLTFSNDQPITPADVKASLCNVMQPASPLAWALLSIEHKTSEDGSSRECTGITLNGNQVTITESKPVPWLLDSLSGPSGWILPSKYEEGAYGVIAGAGPYKVKEIVADSKVVLEARANGSAIKPGVDIVQFNYLPDDTTAASEYIAEKLDVLDLTSPQLVELMTSNNAQEFKYPGTLSQRNWDRVRVAIINEKALAKKGFSKEQIRNFINSFSRQTDREKISTLSGGIGVPLQTPFPPAKNIPAVAELLTVSNFDSPQTTMTIITEADPYSDLIAASLPRQVSNVSISYKGVDKGILMGTLFKGESEIVSMLIEAPVHSPVFWKAFFTPGNPFSIAGKPLPGMEDLDMTSESDITEAGKRILAEGNWVMLMQEKRLQAVAPGISGITFSPSGQTNFAHISKK